jgi:serine/threonine-protein kinase
VFAVGDLVSGKYRLVRLLGDGGMGSVYEAKHEVLGTRVAIKVLHPELARRNSLVERFLQEARVSAQIRSPHVVQVMDVDRTSDGGHAYIVMELLEGEPLSSVLDRQRKLPVSTASEYTLQILEALESAHALGVIHRDLKPENVFVTFLAGRPVLKLIDFGIAKLRSSDPGVQRNLTVAGVVMGTAEYMAPEQARSADKVDGRADIYSVGVMLYEMIAGTRPVIGDDARVIALKVERGEVTPLVKAAPEVPRELAGLVHRAMAARPELRFANATEMRIALADAMSGKRPPTGVMPASPSMASTLPAPAPTPAADGSTTLKGAQVNAVLGGVTRIETGQAPVVARATQLGPQHAHGSPAPAMGLTPSAQAPAMGLAQAPAHVPPAPHEARRRKKSSGIVWLIAVPLILGAGLVAAYVATQSSSQAPEQPTSPPTPATVTPSAKPSAPPSTSPSGEPLAPFVPSAGTAHPGTGPLPHPSGVGGVPTAMPGLDGGVVPTIPIPSTLPSGFPIPSGFPTAWPTALPSGLPFPLPLPQPAPTPSHAAPTPSGPGY